MAARRDAKPLAGLLAGLFAAGLAQDQATLETITNTLGVALDADGVRRALALLAADPDSSEHAPLTALLFSPGPEVLRGLEPALALAGLDAKCAAKLAEAVTKNSAGTVPMLLPEGPPVDFPATAEDLRGFVRRLKAEATAPAELRDILAQRFPVELAADLAVRLRHSRLAWTQPQVFFLAALLERADPKADNLPGLVDWAAGFLDFCDDIWGPEFSPREALAWRRQALETQLRQAEAAEKAQAGGSFEQRMAEGLRLGHVHGPDVRAELALLDRAGALVLGALGQPFAGVAVRDLGTAQDVGSGSACCPKMIRRDALL